MDDLYHDDIYAWSRHQAAVLRGLGTRRDLPNDLDLEHVAEEIEDVGSAQLNSVQSYIRLVFVHLMKAASVPQAESVSHWREEAVTFSFEAEQRFTPSIRQNIDLDAIWRKARRQAEAALGEHGQHLLPTLPTECPYGLDELLGEGFNPGRAMAKLEGGGIEGE